VGAAAAAFFYKRRVPTASAQVDQAFANNTNMNPLYDGMQQFDNPMYNQDTNVDDGFSGATNASHDA